MSEKSKIVGDSDDILIVRNLGGCIFGPKLIKQIGPAEKINERNNSST